MVVECYLRSYGAFSSPSFIFSFDSPTPCVSIVTQEHLKHKSLSPTMLGAMYVEIVCTLKRSSSFMVHLRKSTAQASIMAPLDPRHIERTQRRKVDGLKHQRKPIAEEANR